MWKLRIGVLITSGALGLAAGPPACATSGGSPGGGNVQVVVSPVITTTSPKTAISAITITRIQTYNRRRKAHKHHARATAAVRSALTG